jgi:hypothetical protein
MFKQLKDIPLLDMNHRQIPFATETQISQLQQITSYTFHERRLAQFALVCYILSEETTLN